MSDAGGDHMVETYSCMVLVMALYVTYRFPHVVISMCLELRVSRSIFGLMFIRSLMLSICGSSCVLCSELGYLSRVMNV